MILYDSTDHEEPRLHFRELMTHAREGDESALDEILTRFYGKVRKKVHKSLAHDLRATRPWLHARFSTGDVVQEVFRSVVRDLDDFEGETEDAFTGYLAMIIRNRIMDAVRFHEASRRDVRKLNRGDEGYENAPSSSDPATEVGTDEQISQFRRIFSELSEPEQVLLRGRMEQGYSFEKLGKVLGYPSASTARRAYYAAQTQLALRLKKEGADPV